MIYLLYVMNAGMIICDQLLNPYVLCLQGD